jgi:hypothetical protein
LQQELRDEWGEWIAGLTGWDLFGGLTFDQRRFQTYRYRVPPVDGGMFGESRDSYVIETPLSMPRRVPRDVAVRRFQSWISAGEAALRRRVVYVCALEYQRNGWPHFHPLLDVGELGDGDIETLGRLWFKKNGYGRLEVPRCREAVCSYSAKYLSKDFASGDVLVSSNFGRGEFQRPLERTRGNGTNGHD